MCPSIRGVTRWCIDCISPAQAGPVPYWPTYAGWWGKVKYVVWLGWLSDICICYQFNIMTDTKYRGKYILINLWWLLTCFKCRSRAGRNYTQIRPFHHRWYSLSAWCMQQCSSLQHYAGHCGSLLVPTISLLDHVILGYRGQPAAIWSSSCFLVIHGLIPCDNEGLARPNNWFSGWCFILAVVASCLDWPSKIDEGEIKEILEDISVYVSTCFREFY